MLTNFRFTDWDAGPIFPIHFMDRKHADLLADRVTIAFGARHLHPTAHESSLVPGNPLGEYDCLVSNDPGHNHSSFELVRLRLWEKRLSFARSMDTSQPADNQVVLYSHCPTSVLQQNRSLVLANGKLHYKVGENGLHLKTLSEHEIPLYRLQKITLVLTLLFWT